MMINKKLLNWLPVISLFLIITALPAYANEYPGVYAGDDTLVFIQGRNDTGSLTGIVVLSYEYSMDWVITVGSSGSITNDGMVLNNGHQYVYNADGSRLSETAFSVMNRAINWNSLEFQILPSYGKYITPMVRGGLAFALVEMRSGLPSQLVLASEAYENNNMLNMFEGFLYQLSEGEVSAQVAFTEVAFGAQGLVRGNFPQNFPPPPEDYPVVYPVYPTPGYTPTFPQGTGNYGSSDNQFSQINPGLPVGTEVPEEDRVERPRFNLEPIHNYDVPPITKIGVISFQSFAEIDGYESICDEYLQERLKGIEGLEIVYIPYDNNLLGGLVVYDRAVWLCEKYGVQALMMNTINKIDIPGGLATARTAGTFRVNIKLSSKLIEGYGGRTIWNESFESNQIHDAHEADSGQDAIIKSDLRQIMRNVSNSLVSSAVLNGGHYD